MSWRGCWQPNKTARTLAGWGKAGGHDLAAAKHNRYPSLRPTILPS